MYERFSLPQLDSNAKLLETSQGELKQKGFTWPQFGATVKGLNTLNERFQLKVFNTFYNYLFFSFQNKFETQ